MIVKSKRFFLWFLEIQDNDDNKDDFLRESESHDSPFLFWSLCGTKRNSFIKSKEGTFFSGGRGEIWLIVDPGLGPRRFHVIVGEGGKTWIRGGLFFFLLHAHTHTNTDTYAYTYEGEVVGWRVNDRTMSPVWCTRTLYDDSIWMESGVHSQCIENISSRISLLLGSVSIKGRIHLHSENDRLCDHRLRPPTRASTDRLLRKFDRRWHFRNSKLVMRFG